MAAVGATNIFGMQVLAVDGRMLNLRCPVCHETGLVPVAEFNSTRCGSAKCASMQGRNE